MRSVCESWHFCFFEVICELLLPLWKVSQAVSHCSTVVLIICFWFWLLDHRVGFTALDNKFRHCVILLESERFTMSHPCAMSSVCKSRVSPVSAEDHNFWNPALETCCHSYVSRSLRKKNWEALRCRAASRWPFLDDNHDEQARMLPRPPLAP